MTVSPLEGEIKFKTLEVSLYFAQDFWQRYTFLTEVFKAPNLETLA